MLITVCVIHIPIIIPHTYEINGIKVVDLRLVSAAVILLQPCSWLLDHIFMLSVGHFKIRIDVLLCVYFWIASVSVVLLFHVVFQFVQVFDVLGLDLKYVSNGTSVALI